MRVHLHYGRSGLELEVPDDSLAGEYGGEEYPPADDPAARLREALQNPVEGPRLRDIVSAGSTVAISVEDITRPVPNGLILPVLLEELEAGGVRAPDIEVIIATGLHRPVEDGEMRELLGELPDGVTVRNHDAHDADSLTPVGRTSHGTELSINAAFMAADVRIITGDVEYHQITGYGGGAKSVLPGLSDAESVRTTHARLDERGACAGVLDENPVRGEIEEAARMAGVDLGLNVVLNHDGEVVAASCGEPEAAFRRLVPQVDDIYGVDVPRRYEMVIVDCGGHPRDINLYQAQKAVENALKMTEQGGEVVLAAKCEGGWGSEDFRRWTAQGPELDEVCREMQRDFRMGYHKLYEFALERRHAELFLMSDLKDPALTCFIEPVAPEEVEAMAGVTGDVAILHHGNETVPRVAGEDGPWSAMNAEKPAGD